MDRVFMLHQNERGKKEGARGGLTDDRRINPSSERQSPEEEERGGG